jgi:polyisoprenoid-binding protein YceI
VTPSRSRLQIRAGTALVGHHVFTFGRFRAHVVGTDTTRLLSPVDADPPEAGRVTTFHAEVDSASLEGGLPGMAPFVRDRLLETDLYPRATFDGTARRIPGTSDCAIEGALDLHGVVRTLRFTGTLEETPDALHLVATFELARKAFDLKLSGALDTFVPDDVEVRLDILAQREHVTAEELP